MRYAVVLALAVLLAAAACGGEETQPTPTPQPTASATPTPPATAAPTPTLGPWEPAALDQPKLVFVRGQGDWNSPGTLWISNLDGSAGRQLTSEGARVIYAGAANQGASGQYLFYYVEIDETDRTVWRLDLGTGERSRVLTYDALMNYDYGWSAAVDPGGTHVAYVARDSIEMLDLVTGEVRRLMTGNSAACELGASGCFGYYAVAWSPDGRLLLVRKGYWEGATSLVVDPFTEPPDVHGENTFAPYSAHWSANSDAVCGYGVYASNSGLYVADPPGWEFVNLLPEYVKYPPDIPVVERMVESCAWIDSQHVAFGTEVARRAPPDASFALPERSVEISLLDRRTGEVSSLAVFEGPVQIWAGEMFALPGGRSIITQHEDDAAGSGSSVPSQPEIIDTQTGARTLVLERGDRLVALASP